MGSEPLIDSVDLLLASARPGGTPHKRLLKYRDQLARNVVLGPASMRYIRDLLQQISDSVECRHLNPLGRCRKTRMGCDHIEDNKACRTYSAARPQTKGTPLGRMR
jgi:hypothetical protein